jgi:dephospho-CoA kinase
MAADDNRVSPPRLRGARRRARQTVGRHSMANPQSEIRNPECPRADPQSEIRNPQSTQANPKSEIRNPKSEVPVIGLVGGVAAGKSLVAGHFAQLGCAVVDADRIGHELLAEPAIRDRIRERFGPGVLDGSGRVDRQRLGEAVFSSPKGLRDLEAIVHPILWRRVAEAVQAARTRPGAPAVVLDAALILEKGLDKLCDCMVYVEAEEGTRQRRARQDRGWDPPELARRERAQHPLKFKRGRADYCVDNNTTPERTLDQVRMILKRITSR